MCRLLDLFSGISLLEGDMANAFFEGVVGKLLNAILPSDPSTPTLTTVTTTRISAFSYSLTDNLTVNKLTAVAGTLAVVGAPEPSTNVDNQWSAEQRFREPIADGLFDSTMRRGRSDSRHHHHLGCRIKLSSR
jgi:hypothetical protein